MIIREHFGQGNPAQMNLPSELCQSAAPREPSGDNETTDLQPLPAIVRRCEYSTDNCGRRPCGPDVATRSDTRPCCRAKTILAALRPGSGCTAPLGVNRWHRRLRLAPVLRAR